MREMISLKNGKSDGWKTASQLQSERRRNGIGMLGAVQIMISSSMGRGNVALSFSADAAVLSRVGPESRCVSGRFDPVV